VDDVENSDGGLRREDKVGKKRERDG